MERAKQLSVSLEHKPGRLASLCRCLADASVNIRALAVLESTEHGLVRLVPNKPKAAAAALKAGGFFFTETDVRLVQLPNKVGALAEFAEKCRDRRININFVYGSAAGSRARAILVLSARSLKALEHVAE